MKLYSKLFLSKKVLFFFLVGIFIIFIYFSQLRVRTFENKDGSLRFNYKSRFSLLDEESLPENGIVIIKNDGTSVAFNEERSEESNLEKYSSQNLEIIQEMFPEFEKISQESFNIKDNKRVILIEYKQGGQHSYRLFIPKEEEFLVLTASSAEENWEENEEDFMFIFESLKVSDISK